MIDFILNWPGLLFPGGLTLHQIITETIPATKFCLACGVVYYTWGGGYDVGQ